MDITFYRVDQSAPELVAGRPERAWMNQTDQRFAYRCLPLSIANSSGWEVLCPGSFSAYWNGGSQPGDVQLEAHDWPDMDRHVASHFGAGTITFHTGYLLRTPPGWATWVRGAPNWPKDGIVALDGLVETDWLPFPFTMNWFFTIPGKVRFEKGEPFCFMTPMPHLQLDAMKPKIAAIHDDPALMREYEAWSRTRETFNNKLADGDEATRKEAWQRMYVRGRTATGCPAGETHRSKRRLATPVEATSIVPEQAPVCPVAHGAAALAATAAESDPKPAKPPHSPVKG